MLLSTVSILVYIVILLEIVNSSLTTDCRIDGGTWSNLVMTRLLPSSASSTFVQRDGSVSLLLASGNFLDTTFLAYIATRVVLYIIILCVTSTLSSHHESSPDIDVMNSSSSLITPPFSLIRCSLDCIPTAHGEKYDSTVCLYSNLRYRSSPVITIYAWSPNCGCQPKIVPSSFHVPSIEQNIFLIFPQSSSNIICEIMVQSNILCALFTMYIPCILQRVRNSIFY